MGRGCPLTIFQVIKLLVENDISVLRAPIISEAKRFLSYAKEYIYIRKMVSFYEYEIPTI